MNIAVLGTGLYPFGVYPETTLEDMCVKVLREALAEANIHVNQVEAGYFSNVLAARLEGRQTLGQQMFDLVGINGIPIVNVENACASGSTALHEAAMAIETGRYEVAVVLGVEKLSGNGLGMIPPDGRELEARLGFNTPSQFALRASRYLHQYGGNASALAKVTVKNYRHASLNPHAMFKKNVTEAEVLASPMIADPLTRLQCCALPDGAACVILASRAFANRSKLQHPPVHLAATVLMSGEYKNPPSLAFWESDQRASGQAYRTASIGPSDIDLVEAHDAFTISEVMHYEGLGFCQPGEGLELLQRGETALGGRIPFNPSGGLLGRGHALGATGIAQTIEVVHQLQQRAAERQISGARVGMTHCMGADKEGDARATVVQIYRV